ncbi:unnamed protein product [Alternaria alternata]
MKAVSFILGALASVAFAQQHTLCKDYEYFSSNGYELNNNIWGRSAATSVDGRKGQRQILTSTLGRHITKKPVSQYSNLETEAYWVYDTNNIRCNVAYDLFTSANINHDTSSGDYELMVWLARYDVYPIGTSQGMVTVAGRTWELFYGPNGSMKVYSFVPSSPINNFKANLKDFFTYLQNNKGFPASSQNLITYQFGTEAFTGGPATFTVNQWSANAW